MASLSSAFGGLKRKMGTPIVLIDSNNSLSTKQKQEIHSQKYLALDCEGVSLGRNGELCIVQLSTPTICFLFDIISISKDNVILKFLKDILESTSIIKIIHDCKMDSDALFHLMHIKLTNCHDTQAWDKIIRNERVNLNKTLAYYGCPQNPERDTSVYSRNIRFWATRPLTSMMKEWASGDIASLFKLRFAQEMRLRGLLDISTQKKKANNLSDQSLRKPRELPFSESFDIKPSKMGKFIGKKGSNIMKLNQNPNYFYSTNNSKVIIYALNPMYMKIARSKLDEYKRPKFNFKPVKQSESKRYDSPDDYDNSPDDYDQIMRAAGVPQFYLDNCLD